ncbi:MAG: rod shape-determining protein RodA [Candidatus Viridilinea halotolerans]|uniref:Rod shape-determining protein RodA n=1 Tax=Candidatus Viridilinea halotolerans TaxID=2491704 RepID=A0A426U8M8_9CHLR|nr:MAG: rod shape-determining protein RodA [Candidatus Viridilinea halotolerans]
MQNRIWRDYNWPLLVCVVVLLVFSALAIYSATLNAVARTGVPLSRIYPWHLVYIVVGLGAMMVMTLFNYQLLSSLARPIYLTALFLLMLVLVVGQVGEGARSWIEIGTRTFQPIELAKLGVIIALAAYWHHFEGQANRWSVQLGGLLLMALPTLFVLLQPDLGSALVMVGIWAVMAWSAGMRLSQLLALALVTAPVCYVGWTSDMLLDNYQKQRLLTFYYLLADPAQADFNDSYNVVQALNAIGQGGVFGAGLTHGLFSQGNYVPVQHTDFIFAVIGEEMGFVGGIVLIIFQALLLWQALSIADQARDSFGRLIALGIFAMLFCHMVINIGMNLSLLPVTGLPLPLISAGGSFMITVLAAIGLLQSIALRRHRMTLA